MLDSYFFLCPWVHPGKSEWFHCTRIHTILDERLGVSEIRVMKLLISTFFTLLLIGFAVSSYGQIIETRNYSDGSVYVGEFKDGERSGQGTFTFTDGNVYVGEFEDGQFNGQGTLTDVDGDVYVGELKDGQLNGQGTFIYENGTVENGIWLKNAFIIANNIAPVTEAPPVARVAPILPDSSELLQAASGSGFSVSYDGYLVTNNHVIEGCENVRVHSQGRVIDATVISRDPGNDLAVIKADFRPAAVFALRESNPQLMQDIYVAGYPFGVNLSSSVKVTKGIVSSLTGLGNNFFNI